MIRFPKDDLIQDSYHNITSHGVIGFGDRFGCVLPSSYVDFLCSYNGGILNYHVRYPLVDERMARTRAGGIECFFGLGTDDDYDLDFVLGVFKERIPVKLLPIARALGGDLICLSVCGSERESVYLWDHDGEIGKTTDWSNVYKIATSFERFLASVYVDEGLTPCSERREIFQFVERGDTAQLRQALMTEDANATNEEGCTLVMCAAWSQRPAAMRILLQNGAQTERKDPAGRTALHYAAAAHSLDCVKLLVLHGAHINARDANEETPLVLSIKALGCRVPLFLISSGADVQAISKTGDSALNSCQNERIRTALLAVGASV